jgi:hypothetical protein
MPDNELDQAVDDEQGLPPSEAMALIERQRGEVAEQLRFPVSGVFAAWGIAYLVGFALAFAATQRLVPVGVPVGVGLPLGIASIAYSAARGVAAGRGISGRSQMAGAMYGWSWTLGFAGLYAVNFGLMSRGLSMATVSLLWSGSALLLAGVLYLAGGALWGDRAQYMLGVWMIASAAGSVFAGYPGDFLVLSLAGGGGFLLMSVFYGMKSRKRAR